MSKTALERLGLVELVKEWGVTIIPRRIGEGDPECPSLGTIEPGDGYELERVEEFLQKVWSYLSPEQQPDLINLVASIYAHVLDTAALDVAAREKLDKSTARQNLASLGAGYARMRWREDPNIRVGEMAEYVRDKLIIEGERPPGIKQIRAWIQWCTPPAAKRPGRPRKN